MRDPILVFDLDDTLYPERQYALSGFRAAARWAHATLGIAGLDADMTRLLDAGHLGRLFALALSAHRPDHTADQLAGLVAAYREHEPEIALFADAERALAHWRARGPLGLVTDGTHAMQRRKVAALGVEAHFRSIVYTDALGGRDFFKPHPRAFEVTAAALGAEPSRLVYVGDNPAKDFLAPNAAGWTTVQVRRVDAEHRRIHHAAVAPPGGAAHHVVDSLDALPDVLGV